MVLVFLSSFIDDPRLQGAVDLLDELLVCDPEKRLTAESALTHSYFFTTPRAAEPNSAEYVLKTSEDPSGSIFF